MTEIIRARIAELEKQYKKIEKKIFPMNDNTVKNAIELEKIRYAITQLYICLGAKLKCVSWSLDEYFYYYYFKDEENNCYYWKTKSAKLQNACYNEGQFLKPFDLVKWNIKDVNNEHKFYNNEWYEEIVIDEWKLV